MRILLFGETGTIGQATCRSLLMHGHQVVSFIRSQSAQKAEEFSYPSSAHLERRYGEICNLKSTLDSGFRGEQFDAVISCIASRTGATKDAWNIDFLANSHILQGALENRVEHFILLSAICVQKPKLAFQQAKLAFESRLIESSITYSIVRPTAFFKSLSGQIERLRQGKPFLMFGDGTLTRCKPISDGDLANYLVSCLENSELQNKILPIGGPGPAISPLEQAQYLFKLLNKPARFRCISPRLLDVVVTALSVLGRLLPGLQEKAELAKIGRYYATESMLALNPKTNKYSEDLTPSTGEQTLFDYYERIIAQGVQVDLREHRVF
jgi:divinyl chlorophyllide a 8-vinyl-reductase